MNNQPNIFNYATKELTQDAFITWLLYWASSKYRLQNEPLHLLGKSFLASLLARQNIILQDNFCDYKIIQQDHRIDVFVSLKFNDTTYGIIIEDKVHSTDHSNQLEIYKNKIINKKICDELVLIYFKTGYQVNLSSIITNKYHHYSVKDFLKILTSEKVNEINNDILTQYHSYIVKKEQQFDHAEIESNNYLIKPIKDWKRWSCVRFFHDYKEHFKANWGEVPNNREALLAFWFGGRDLIINNVNNLPVKYILYMDIIFGDQIIKVSYRISLNGNEQKDAIVRDKILKAFVPFLKNYGIEYKKPKFTKAKKTMLLTQITNLDNSMNYDSFVKQIEVYQEALNEFVNNQ